MMVQTCLYTFMPGGQDSRCAALEPASPARPSLLNRLFGSSKTRQQQGRHITERRRGFISDTVPSTPSEEQRLLQVQINTEAAEQMMVISRMETPFGRPNPNAKCLPPCRTAGALAHLPNTSVSCTTRLVVQDTCL